MADRTAYLLLGGSSVFHRFHPVTLTAADYLASALILFLSMISPSSGHHPFLQFLPIFRPPVQRGRRVQLLEKKGKKGNSFLSDGVVCRSGQGSLQS